MTYTEQLRMPPHFITLLALPFALTVVGLAVVQALVPLPLAGRITITAAMLLVAVVATLLLVALSRVRITIDDQALTIALRILFRTRIALGRIVSCAPTDAAVWGVSYQYRGRAYRVNPAARRAVLLRLTNGAQVVFGTRDAPAACAARRARRPAIVAG